MLLLICLQNINNISMSPKNNYCCFVGYKADGPCGTKKPTIDI